MRTNFNKYLKIHSPKRRREFKDAGSSDESKYSGKGSVLTKRVLAIVSPKKFLKNECSLYFFLVEEVSPSPQFATGIIQLQNSGKQALYKNQNLITHNKIKSETIMLSLALTWVKTIAERSPFSRGSRLYKTLENTDTPTILNIKKTKGPC